MRIYLAGHAANAKGFRGGEKSLIAQGARKRMFSFYWREQVERSLKDWRKVQKENSNDN